MMSYAIFEIVYGIPLVDPDNDMSDDLAELIDSQEYSDLIQTRYSGHADQVPTFCGISLGRFSECYPLVEVNLLKLTPGESDIGEFNKLFYALPEDAQAMIRAYGGEPRVFFLTHTS